jgi:hypothetical protein
MGENAPFHQLSQPRGRQPGELLFSFLKEDDRIVCELRCHGEQAFEVQFYRNEAFWYGRQFATRALAIQWATFERQAIQTPSADP